MKYFLMIAVILITGMNSLLADQDSEYINHPLSIGAAIGYKVGINAADVPEGIKNGINFSNMPDLAAQAYIPFQGNNMMGLLANIGYYTYPYKFATDPATVDKKYNFSYIVLGLDFYLSGFTIGLNYGFPSSAKYKEENQEFDLNSDLLANMFEFRIGGQIPLIVDQTGRLNLNINAGYFITGQFNDDRAIQGKNTNPASLTIGLSYLFNLVPNED